MSTKEIKQIIVDKIQEVEDDNLLEEVYRILEIGQLEQKMFSLSEVQMKEIDFRLDEMDNGIFLTNEEAEKELDEWLKK